MNNLISKKYKNIELVSQERILISINSIDRFSETVQFYWVNPRINNYEYPFKEEYLGGWEIQVLRTSKKMKFEDIVMLCKEDGYQPANIYHMINFIKHIDNLEKYKSLMAPGSLCIDDFEYPGCVVLNHEKDRGFSLGMGNWRGNKIGEYSILRVKKIN